jgi:hypothetical protein
MRRAAYHQMATGWHREKRGVDGQARPVMVKVNDNPNYDEDAYRFCVALAKDALRDVAQYQSPKLSAVAGAR